MPWNLARSVAGRELMTKRKRRVCFYCNDYSLAEATYHRNRYEWTCCLCDAVNLVDENGEILDVVPDPPQNGHVSAPPFAAENESDSPFCRNCQTNHMIVAEALANYLPPEGDSQYAKYENGLAAYKADLERRYPPYCADCQTQVFGRLAQNNYAARSRILGSLLKDSSPIPSRPAIPSVGSGKLLKQRWTFERRCKVVLWLIRGILWVSYLSTFWGLLAINALLPHSQLRKLALVDTHDRPTWRNMVSLSTSLTSTIIWRMPDEDSLADLGCQLYSLLYYATPLSIFFFFWNYRLLFAFMAPVKVTVRGKSQYYLCQSLSYLLILLALYSLPRMYFWNFSEKSFKLVNMFLATTSCLTSASALTCLKVVKVRKRGLSEEKKVEDSLPKNVNTEAPGSISDSVFHMNVGQILNDYRQPSGLHHAERETRVIPDMDEMDWKPAFVPQSMTAVVPGPLPDIPSLPSGYALPPPPNGSIVNSKLISQARVISGLKPTQSKERYFQHRVSKSVPQIAGSWTKVNSDERNLASQKFFPPEAPTGLEELFDPALTLSEKQNILLANDKKVRALKGSRSAPPHMFFNTYSGWVAASVMVTGALVVTVYVLYKHCLPAVVSSIGD